MTCDTGIMAHRIYICYPYMKQSSRPNSYPTSNRGSFKDNVFPEGETPAMALHEASSSRFHERCTGDANRVDAMSALQHSHLVELRARVIVIKSYVQYLCLESTTMPQYHDMLATNLTKLQLQVDELESLTSQLCEGVNGSVEERVPTTL
jgi:hypothetical protein